MTKLTHQDLDRSNLESLISMANKKDRDSQKFAAVFMCMVHNVPPEIIEKLVKSPYYEVSEDAIKFCKNQKEVPEETVRAWLSQRSSCLRRAAVMVMSGWDTIPKDLEILAFENEYEQVRLLALDVLNFA